jgi:hypothetical protein
MEKYGIFLINGPHSQYGTTPTIGLSKLHIADFESVEDAAKYIRENQIQVQCIILQYWTA